ncbi:MAG: MBL fold metallo-hydrolase [Pseudonocardiaceae bacterium]
MTTYQLAAPPAPVEVAEDVWAYTELPGGWCVSNAGAVVGREGPILIDTLATERRARRLSEWVDGLRVGPRRMIVNTHSHGDHHFGNHLFGPAAVIFAHEQARREMDETGLALTRLWPAVSWGDVRVTLPTVTFSDRITVHIGQKTAELIFVGPAHTTNDVVVWLPQDKVLFAGDVTLCGATPFLLMGSLTGSLAAIDRLAALGVETVVCGHGPVAGPEVFAETTAYLRWVQQLAKEGSAAGLAPLAVARDTDLGEFSNLLDPERLVGNLHRAYDELGDNPLADPLDVMGIFNEMVEYNGGRVPTCLA